jgi:hypothetical protein
MEEESDQELGELSEFFEPLKNYHHQVMRLSNPM